MFRFHLVTGSLGLLVCIRLIALLALPWPARLAIGLLVLAASQSLLVQRRFFSVLSAPELPMPVLLLSGWGLGSVLIAAVLVAGLDLSGLLLAAAGWPAGGWLLSDPGLRLVAGGAAMSLAAAGVWQAVQLPAIRRCSVTLARLPAALDGFRIVQLSDLHISRLLGESWVRRVVRRSNALQPDLLVITGDLVDGELARRAGAVAPLQQLQARHGVYAVAGNHEYYSRFDPWMAHFRQLGIRMLENSHVLIPAAAAPGARLILAGVTDAAAGGYGRARPDLKAALAGAPAGLPVVLLAHRPTRAAEHARRGVDLQLSGHTHGGQVLLMHWLVRRANQGFIAGFYRVQDMLLYVSRGTGLWAGFPLRLGCPSEITEITLRAPAAAGRSPLEAGPR